MPADLLLLNGTVLTLDAARPRAEALALLGGRVLAVGDRVSLADLRGPKTEVLDLHGGCALPAFTDSHCHLNAYGLAMEEVDCSLEAAPTLEAIREKIGEAARAAAPGEWIQARAYDDTRLRPQRHPTRWDLDAVAPDHPVILRRRCGHVCVANSLALRMAGISVDGPEVPGGKIDRDERGEPTGVLRERAQDLVRDLIPPPPTERIKRGITRAAERYLREGIAAVHDAGGARMEELLAYRELAEEERLPLRVVLMVRPPWLEHCIGAGIATGFGGERITVGPVKLFADGGIGPRTAAVTRPYHGEPDNLGVLRLSEEELSDTAVLAARAGFAVAIHAIGDEAVRAAIAALARAMEERAPGRYPHRIEHCVLPGPGDIETMRRLNIAAAVQPAFLHTLGDSWLEALDADLAERCYPLRSMWAAGVLITGGSDCPVVPSSPLLGVSSLVTRRTASGRSIAPAEAIEIEAALRVYTDLPPRLMGEQNVRGRLSPGLAGDVTVLSADPTQIPAEALPDVEVWATITGGRVRYLAPAPVLS